jgi:uncharacterized protein YjdB/VanZ family protein
MKQKTTPKNKSTKRIKPSPSKLFKFRWWLLVTFIFSNSFISANSVISANVSSDLSTTVTETFIAIVRAILPPAKVVIVPATSVTFALPDNTSNIYIGSSNRLTATVLPDTTTDKTLTWTSSNPTVIEVTNGGIAIGRSFGTATITATSKTEGVFGTKAITVIDFPSPTDFSIRAFIGDQETTTIEKDTTAKIRIENIVPSNARFGEIVLTSSDESIARINDDGIVYGVAIGNVDITAQLGPLEKSLSLEIKDEIDVIAPTTLTLSAEPIIYVGRPQAVTIDFGEDVPTDTQVTFSSSNTSFARISSNGLVTPVNYAGYENKEVIITAYANAKEDLVATVTITIAKVFPTSLQIRVAGTVEAGKTITITPTFGPVDVTDRQLTYTSSDPTIATVSSTGDVGQALGLKEGKVIITARSLMDPNLTATLELEVLPKTLLTPDVISQIFVFIRKGVGHMGLNFINGLIGFLTFYAFFSKHKYRFLWISLAFGFVIGFINEGLQFFAPGRTPTFDDVSYNVFGYWIAQLIMFAGLWFFKLRHLKPQPKKRKRVS